MHPAPSVILFTVASGLGFGAIFWLGLGLGPTTTGFAWLGCVVAGLLTVAGLVSSTFHLGHPERAIKAFSQWRTSWLSREGVLSVAMLVLFGIYFLCWAFLGARIAPIGWLVSLLCLGAVYATSMIYAQLKTVPRWNSMWTNLMYLSLSLAGGLLVVLALGASTTITSWLALVLTLIAGICYFMYRANAVTKTMEAAGTPESATGLGFMGKVSLLESPHSSPNYLMKEMVFQVGRSKAAALSKLALVLAFLVPMIALLLLAFTSFNLLVWIALASHVVGVVASRWLFFAEAEHVVSLYYGKR